MSPDNEKLCTPESTRIGHEFVENWSHTISLIGDSNERDLLTLIEVLDQTRLNWQKSETECNMHKNKTILLENDVATLQKENQALQNRLRKSQVQLAEVTNGKKEVEAELAEVANGKKEVEDELAELKRSIKKLHTKSYGQNHDSLFVECSSESPSAAKLAGGSYDNSGIMDANNSSHHSGVNGSKEVNQTHVDLDQTADFLKPLSKTPNVLSSRKRRSRSHAPYSRIFDSPPSKEKEECDESESKRSRNDTGESQVADTIEVDPDDHGKPNGSVLIRRALSETESTKKKVHLTPKAGTFSYARSTFDILKSRVPQSWNHGENIEKRSHREIKFHPVFESCDVCKKRFGFTANNALRCCDCNARYHDYCKSSAPMPCVPKMILRKNSSKKIKPLVYYCPDTHPFIPPLLIHCIVGIERHHLDREGIYRVPGNEAAVAKLYTEFMTSRVVPDLANLECETITSCIKKFLKELRDQLVPASSFDEFFKAIKNDDHEDVIQYVLELPSPNRDTLAYFILHLQKVGKNCHINRMPIVNLARILAPTIIGYSKLHSKTLFENPTELILNQCVILERLLKIPSEFWNRFITHNMSAVLAAEARTPGSKAALLTFTPKNSSENVETFDEAEDDETH